MSEKYETYQEYWTEVRSAAKIQLEEAEENDDDDLLNDPAAASMLAGLAVEGAHILMYYPRSVIYHTEGGFGGEGHTRFLAHREFEDNNGKQMLNAIASAAYFNDVKEAIEKVLEARGALGEAMRLIDDAIYSEGVPASYAYEKGITDPEIMPYRFEHIIEGEWRMIDPDGEKFEVISPRVIVENSNNVNPEIALKQYLDNKCARREHERDSDE